MKYLWYLGLVLIAVRTRGQVASMDDKVHIGSHRTFYAGDKLFVPKGVNYYPAKTPWKLFWTQYDSNTVAKDLDIMTVMHFNTLRVFVDVQKEDTAIATQTGYLKDLLDKCGQKGLKVIVTLFDFMQDYSEANKVTDNSQIKTLLSSFRDHPALFAWDLKNEPDLDFGKGRATVLAWLKAALQKARTYDSCHLITIGWAYSENATLLADQVDFVSFHSYRSPDTLAVELQTLQAAVRNKPLMLEEFGFSTFDASGSGDSAVMERRQAHYFSRIRRLLTRKGQIPWLMWTLHDFNYIPPVISGTSELHRGQQARYGIIRPNKSLKPGAMVLSR